MSDHERIAAKLRRSTIIVRSAEGPRMRGMSRIPTAERRAAAIRRLIEWSKRAPNPTEGEQT